MGFIGFLFYQDSSYPIYMPSVIANVWFEDTLLVIHPETGIVEKEYGKVNFIEHYCCIEHSLTVHWPRLDVRE